MAKVKVPGERFRVEFVAITVGLAAPFFAVSLLLVFFPSLLWTLPAWEVGLVIGLLVMPWAFGFWGLFLGFRYYTDKVIWSNRVMECSNSNMVDLGPRAYPFDDSSGDPTLDPAKREALVRAGAIRPENAPKSQLVDCKALALGGFWWGGFAVHPGADGYILFFGKEWLNLHGNILIAKNVILIHHSEIDQDILRDLEQATTNNGAGRFIAYHTALYVCGDTDAEILEYMCSQPEIREGVLERIGVAGVAREFASKVLKVIGQEKARELGISMKGWEVLVNPARDYLLAAGLYSEAAQRGMQTVGGLRAENRRLQDMITNLQTERKVNVATISMYYNQLHANARRELGYQPSYGQGQQTPTGIGPDRTRPGYDNAIDGRP
ncbi:MAG: hypothetical protein WCB19_05785 [Thermoplasmata archaeon]